MRPISLAAIVLFPVLAHAQASTATPANTVQASLSPMEVAAASSAAVATTPATHRVIVHTRVDFEPALLSHEPSLGYTFYSGESNMTAPKLLNASTLGLSRQELQQEVADHGTVTARMFVDTNGVPSQVTLLHSLRADLDAKALQAFNQSRFTPATLDKHAVSSVVTLQVSFRQQ